MKKIFLILLVCFLSLVICTSCNKEDGPGGDNNNGNNNQQTDKFDAETFTYFEELHMNEDKELLVFNRSESLSFEKELVCVAIQGIYSRTNQKFYNWSSGSYDTWLNDLVANYGFTTRDITFNEMVEMYRNDYDNGYLLYDKVGKVESANVACTICGITGYLPVDKTIEQEMINLGFELKKDVSTYSQKKCFNEYSDQLNNKGLLQEKADVPHMKDYGIACKYFIFYDAGTTTQSYMFRGTVQNWCEPNSPIFGWGPGQEDEHVAISSQNGQFTLASDWSKNMTVFACSEIFRRTSYTQKYKETTIQAESGKHYVTIQMSDGDNVQCWYNSFPFNSKYWGGTRTGDFPMGFSMQPSLIDLGANILNYIYDNSQPNDYYVCAVSGQGYIYPQVYLSSALDDYLKGLSVYMKNTDLSVVQILDSGPNQGVIDAYAKVEEVKGGIYCFGEKYAGGRGSVYWSNDKPFVCVRETLWSADVTSMANRINHYKKDPTSIEGYTVINLHPWSMSYADVVQLVSLLDENVVVVSADDFIRLITDNVPHKNTLMV